MGKGNGGGRDGGELEKGAGGGDGREMKKGAGRAGELWL